METDSGTGAAARSPLTPGAAGSSSNSQCTLNGQASTVVSNGNTLALTLAVTFKPAFSGTQTLFGFASDNGNLNSTWQTLGTWKTTAPVAVAPTARHLGGVQIPVLLPPALKLVQNLSPPFLEAQKSQDLPIRPPKLVDIRRIEGEDPDLQLHQAVLHFPLSLLRAHGLGFPLGEPSPIVDLIPCLSCCL